MWIRLSLSELLSCKNNMVFLVYALSPNFENLLLSGGDEYEYLLFILKLSVQTSLKIFTS